LVVQLSGSAVALFGFGGLVDVGGHGEQAGFVAGELGLGLDPFGAVRGAFPFPLDLVHEVERLLVKVVNPYVAVLTTTSVAFAGRVGGDGILAVRSATKSFK